MTLESTFVVTLPSWSYQQVPFLKEFGYALVHSGLPVYTVEFWLLAISAALGVSLNVVAIQNTLWLSFE